MEKIILEQVATTGKIKTWQIWTEAEVIYRLAGLKNGKLTQHISYAAEKNIGKKNYITAKEQAVIEAEALIKKQRRRGYVEEGTLADIMLTPFRFYPLGTSFAPSKPIITTPKDWVAGSTKYCGERKNNGVNILFVVTLDGTVHVYSRGIQEITHLVKNIPEIHNFMNMNLQPESIYSVEFVHYDKNDKEVPKDLRGVLNERTTTEKAEARYNKLIDDGSTFAIKLFDILIHKHESLSKTDYIDRRKIMVPYWLQDPTLKSEWFDHVTEKDIEDAQTKGWEGYVLRELTGPGSHTGYTMNGKPGRKGVYKLVFDELEDFFITETLIGSKGRLLGLPSKFHLAQIDKDTGEVIDCAWTGPGKLTTEDLKEFAEFLRIEIGEEFKGQTVTTNKISVAVKFRERKPTDALEFPRIIETRPDKTWGECYYAETV